VAYAGSSLTGKHILDRARRRRPTAPHAARRHRRLGPAPTRRSR